MRRNLFVAAVLVAALAACASSPKPAEETSRERFKHTFDFMWGQTEAELAEEWKIESADKATRTLVTSWNEQMHPMSHFGVRRRITVTLEGDEVEGFLVKAKEEAEKNTEEVTPMSKEDADWDPTDTDGARAKKILMNLYIRLHPKETWKENEIR